MSDPKTRDDLLSDFLHEEAERRNKGITIEKLAGKVDLLADQVNRLYTAVNRCTTVTLQKHEDQRRYARRTQAIENQLEQISARMHDVADFKVDPSEITGTHQLQQIQAIQKKLDEDDERKRDDNTWSKRQRWILLCTILAGLIVAGVAGCATYVVTHVEVRK